MPKMSPETVQICQDLLTYWDEPDAYVRIALAGQLGLICNGCKTVVEASGIYIYRASDVMYAGDLIAHVKKVHDELYIRGTPADNPGWTDLYTSPLEMLREHEA